MVVTVADGSGRATSAENGGARGYSARVGTATSTPLVTMDRAHAARDIAAELGLDLLVVTPGADLRYLSGYNAHAMERLTALAVPRTGEPFLVVPRLEAPMVDAGPAGSLGLEVLAWDETDDPFALLARTATARLGRAPVRVAVGVRTWAEHALGVQHALPGSALELASPVIDRLRMVKSAAEIDELAAAGAAIDRVHARVAEGLRGGRGPRGGGGGGGGAGGGGGGGGGSRPRRGDPRGGPRRRRLHHRRVRA